MITIYIITLKSCHSGHSICLILKIYIYTINKTIGLEM